LRIGNCRDTLTNSGQPTLEESLNQMPQITPDFGRSYQLMLLLQY
jgi:hypothetical protein